MNRILLILDAPDAGTLPGLQTPAPSPTEAAALAGPAMAQGANGDTVASAEMMERAIADLTAENQKLRQQVAAMEPAAKRLAGLKIELPDGFKARIRKFIGDLEEAVKRAPERRQELTAEISRLETTKGELSEEIISLHGDAVNDDTAAATLNTKESRLRQVNARLEELRGTLAALKPVTLVGAGQLVSDIVRFYSARLPLKIMAFIEPICPEGNQAQTITNLSSCMVTLRHLSNWAILMDREEATPQEVAHLADVLNRALRGQPHLGIDSPDWSPAPGISN